MRREGRLHGHETNKDHERVLTHNKPTNRSKLTGKCHRRSQCRHCRYDPPDRSMKKIKGQYKKRSMDVTFNQLLKDWALAKNAPLLVPRDMERGQEEPYDEENDDYLEEENCAYAPKEFTIQSHHVEELAMFYEELIDQSGVACIAEGTPGEWQEVAPHEICSEIESDDEDWCML